MAEPFFSIIVPFYNVPREFFRQTMESFIGQTFADFEIILVDDGSDAEGALLCDSFAAQDHRIRVFHLENGGVSAARNFGLSAASGKWVLFVDADDWLEPDACERLYTELSSRQDPDILQFKAYRNYPQVQKPMGSDFSANQLELGCSPTEKQLAYRAAMQAPNMLRDSFLTYHAYFVWDKVFRLSFLREHHIAFPEDLPVSEDQVFCLRCLQHYSYIARCNARLYHYRQSENSTIHRYYPGLAAKRLALYEQLEQIYSEICEELHAEPSALRRDLDGQIVMSASSVLFRQFYHAEHPHSGRRREALAFLNSPQISAALSRLKLKELSRVNALRVLLLKLRLPGAVALLAELNRRRQTH